MTIVASVRQTVPLRADLPAAAQALAHIAGRTPQRDQSSSIDKAPLDCIYLIIPPHSVKQLTASIRRHSAPATPRSKSP